TELLTQPTTWASKNLAQRHVAFFRNHRRGKRLRQVIGGKRELSDRFQAGTRGGRGQPAGVLKKLTLSSITPVCVLPQSTAKSATAGRPRGAGAAGRWVVRRPCQAGSHWPFRAPPPTGAVRPSLRRPAALRKSASA